MKYKFLVRLIIIIVAAIIATVGWFEIGQATPKIEHVKIGARDIAMGAGGDSPVETRSILAKDHLKLPGQSNQADGEGNKSSGDSPKAAGSLTTFLDNIFTPGPTTITLAYTCVTEKLVVDKIIPAFQKYWFDKTGQEVNFNTGYSLPDFDTMATSISDQPVQVVIMSSSTNAETRGYSQTKWHDTANKGAVFSSTQVFLVRKGNPLRLKSFADLTIPGVRVLHLSPILGTGGGLWQAWAFYGSALRETEVTQGEKDYQVADEQLKKIEDNAYYDFTDFPSTKKAFLNGMGDVIVFSEGAVLSTVKANPSVEMVVPSYTIVNDFLVYKMENNIGFGDKEVVAAFIDFLFTPEVQEYAAESGYRPSDPAILAQHQEFKALDNPIHLSYLGEQTDMKKKIILEKWLKNNNNRPR